jgi:disulfide bond formation protein DsbB
MTPSDYRLGSMAVVGIGAVGAALVTQHVFGMQPCAWCVLQRMIFLAIAAASLVGLLWRAPLGRRIGAGLALVLAACGVSAATWQHFVAANTASCDLSLAERVVGATGLDGRWPDVFMPMASCADAAVTLAGLPYEFWSLGLFIGLGATALIVLRRP